MDMKSSDNSVADLSADILPYIPAGEIFDVEIPSNNGAEPIDDSALIFDEDGYSVSEQPVPGYESFSYMPFGANDELPFDLIRTVGSDEVISQNLFFNILTTYGAGLQYMDPKTKQPSADKDIRRFLMRNSIREFYLEQCTDMKYFFFAVAVVILDRKGEKIVQIRHKDACYCRFEKADGKGRINHVFFANWRKKGALRRRDVEMLTLLNEKDPLGHLEVLFGKAPGADGLTRVRTNEKKFAVVMRYPTPGQRYYPAPYYTSLFRGDWFDLKRLIGKGKKAKIRNHAPIKYQVEVHRDYWSSLIAEERITDPAKMKERIDKEKQNIKKFVCGVENSGKVWITGYYIDAYGKEQRMVRINLIDTGKEGGDWSEDIQETSNMLCYGMNVHPNLVGATPGKSQSNNSGSDKRELFTLKESLEQSFHDILLKVHELVIYFNGWEDKAVPQVPIVLLTTLDKNTDAVKKTPDGETKDPNDQ